MIVKEESDPDLKADPGKLENPREPNVIFGKWLDYSTEQMQAFQKKPFKPKACALSDA